MTAGRRATMRCAAGVISAMLAPSTLRKLGRYSGRSAATVRDSALWKTESPTPRTLGACSGGTSAASVVGGAGVGAEGATGVGAGTTGGTVVGGVASGGVVSREVMSGGVESRAGELTGGAGGVAGSAGTWAPAGDGRTTRVPRQRVIAAIREVRSTAGQVRAAVRIYRDMGLPQKNRMCSTLRVSGICDGRVVVITGAGRGIGRGHALEFARQGAKVVVNDLGAEIDGSGGSDGPAGEVVDAIRAAGGEAVANGDDVADWDGAARLIGTAIDVFGGLDVVVNNAGFLRDRMLVSTSEQEWDAVIRVHLKGHFCPARHASAYWRERAEAGEPVVARFIYTRSGAGLLGSVGQGNYSAAKAGIAALTLVQAAEMGRYGVTANAIAPAARTRMTEAVFADTMGAPGDGAFDAMAPDNVAPLVVWLGSAASGNVTGRVFEVEGGVIRAAEGWQHGAEVDKGARWEPGELGPVVRSLLAQGGAPAPVYGA